MSSPLAAAFASTKLFGDTRSQTIRFERGDWGLGEKHTIAQFLDSIICSKISWWLPTWLVPPLVLREQGLWGFL